MTSLSSIRSCTWRGVNAKDIIDAFYDMLAALSRVGHLLFVRTQTGYLRWYALSMAAGLVALIAVGVLL